MGHTNNTDLELFARCASGFEQTLAAELRDLRARRVRPLRGGVAFFGSLADAYRACLWSRVATRVQLVLARVPATDAQALYNGVVGFAWEEHVPADATIFVDAHGQNDQLRNTKFTALKVKDALCDRLRDRRGTRPDVSTTQPDFSVNVALHQHKATLYLNLSGPSLHRRGYREDGVSTEAPLKETLAAGLLLAADWPRLSREGGMLVDPMCGSGTLAIEAALILENRAPGLLRTRWGFQGWKRHDERLWASVVEQAEAACRAAEAPRILAGDIDPQALAIACDNAKRAQIPSAIRFYKGDAQKLDRYLKRLYGYQDAPGLLVANPPYGQRLLSGQELPQTYAALSAGIEAIPTGWHVALITPDAGVDSALGRTPHTTISCFNGPIATWVRLYRTDEPRLEHSITSLAGVTRRMPIAQKNSAQFAARLRKVARERSRWARKEQVACYRIYDADLPEFAFSIDLFALAERDPEGQYVRIAEHRRPSSVDSQQAAQRLADAAAIASATLDVPRSHVLPLAWEQDAREPYPITVAEGPLTFTIDLAKPDARLPLALRSVRQLAGELGHNKRVACLFATGASALAHAAANAQSTIVVDASKPQLDAARALLRDNGIAGKQHRTHCQDVRAWLKGEARARRSYDVVLCVAPSWLPAKDAGGREWDLRAELNTLLRNATAILASGGTLLFACPDADFTPGPINVRTPGARVEDITSRVIPHDFARSRKTPCCLLVHKDQPSQIG